MYKFLFALLLTASYGYAQQGGVVAAGSAETNDYKMTFVVGQPLSGGVNNTSLKVSQGLLQPSTTVLLSEEEVYDDQFVKVFPNPVNELLYFQFGRESSYSVQVYNLQGQLLKKFQYDQINSSLNFSTYSSGTYVLMVRDIINNKVSTFKVLKN